MSALLGRIPSAVGYKPTLATDIGALQERITTTTKGWITYRAQRFTCRRRPNDPRRRPHSRISIPTTVLSRDIATKAFTGGRTRSIRPRACSRRSLSARSTTLWPGECRRSASATRRCRTLLPSSGLDELSEEDKLNSARAREIERFLSQPFPRCRGITGWPGELVDLQDSIKRLQRGSAKAN